MNVPIKCSIIATYQFFKTFGSTSNSEEEGENNGFSASEEEDDTTKKADDEIYFVVGELMYSEQMGDQNMIKITGIEEKVIKFKKIINGNKGNVKENLLHAKFLATFKHFDIKVMN